MGLKSLRFFNGLFSLFMAAILIVTMLYAGFALWDNHQIYHAAESVFDEMKEIKARMVAQVQADEEAAAQMRASEGTAALPTTEKAGVETVVVEAPSSSTEALTTAGAAEVTESVAITGTTETTASAAGSNAKASTETITASEVNPATEIMTATDSTGGQIVVQAQGITGTVEIRPAEAREADVASESLEAVPDAKALAEAEAARAAEEAAAAEKEARLASYQSYGAPFDELKAINPDVNGWLTMPETAIDYPLVQGETNYSYINTDVYGEFALSGSIFLDSRNDNEYLDVYSLLYGHNMSKHRMFGDVNLYKDQEFFEANQQGELYLPDKKHTLQAVSCIVCSASDWVRFNPERWSELTNEEILQYAQEDALYVSETGLNALQTVLEAGEKPRLVALSTCSNEFTDARTILLTIMDPVSTETTP